MFWLCLWFRIGSGINATLIAGNGGDPFLCLTVRRSLMFIADQPLRDGRSVRQGIVPV